MGAKEQAEYLFSRIGWGQENAVMRPANGDVDRLLRDLVKKHNSDKDKPGVIINVGNGYYKPRKRILAELSEYREYRNKDDSRERELHHKGEVMDLKFFNPKLIGEIQTEDYEQLSLPV